MCTGTCALRQHICSIKRDGDGEEGCQEIGLVALMFFFEFIFSYVSLTISFYVSLTNLFLTILFLIC